ncbi:MAG: plastocyanin/azurin family copper-binding protein [Opitutaceae bacterium]
MPETDKLFGMKKLLLLSTLLASALAFTGCGGGDTTTETAKPAEPASTAKVIKVTGNDQMRFNITEIKVKAGETVRVQLTNIGQMPAQAMSHNFVVLNRAVTEEEFVAFATAASQNPPTYLPAQSDLVLAHTKTLGPGASDTIEFTAPAAGTYEFLCTFPGHYALMRGKMIVE